MSQHKENVKVHVDVPCQIEILEHEDWEDMTREEKLKYVRDNLLSMDWTEFDTLLQPIGTHGKWSVRKVEHPGYPHSTPPEEIEVGVALEDMATIPPPPKGYWFHGKGKDQERLFQLYRPGRKALAFMGVLLGEMDMDVGRDRHLTLELYQARNSQFIMKKVTDSSRGDNLEYVVQILKPVPFESYYEVLLDISGGLYWKKLTHSVLAQLRTDLEDKVEYLPGAEPEEVPKEVPKDTKLPEGQGVLPTSIKSVRAYPEEYPLFTLRSGTTYVVCMSRVQAEGGGPLQPIGCITIPPNPTEYVATAGRTLFIPRMLVHGPSLLNVIDWYPADRGLQDSNYYLNVIGDLFAAPMGLALFVEGSTNGFFMNMSFLSNFGVSVHTDTVMLVENQTVQFDSAVLVTTEEPVMSPCEEEVPKVRPLPAYDISKAE